MLINNLVMCFITAFVGEYLETSKEEESKNNKSFLEGYKSILNAKSNEESLVSKPWFPLNSSKLKFYCTDLIQFNL